MEEDIIHPAETFDHIEEDLPLEKLLKMSKSFKMGVEKNLNKYMKEKLTMMNEVTKIGNSTTTPNEESNETIDNSSFVETPLNKHGETDSSFSFLKQKCEAYNNLGQELKNEHESLLDTQHIENEFKPNQNMISELHGISNCNQADNEKINYIKSILEIEDKRRYWMDKYDELYDKCLRLESDYMNAEKENCNNQMEIARMKTIENENSRLNQTIDKTNRVRKQLESALESCLEEVNKYKNDADIARNKVREAVEMVEKLCSEKDQLMEDLNNSKEQISRLENELKNLIQESEKKVRLEVENVKTTYKNKLREANVEIEALRSEKQIESIKTQRISKEYDILNKNYSIINQKYADEPHEYSKKVTVLIKQINEYEVTLNNITANVEFLKETNRKLQDSYARKKTKYTMEIKFLKDTSKSLENNLNKAITEIAENSETIVTAADRIKTLEMEISKLKRPEDKCQQKNLQIKELTKHLEAFKQLLDMWKIEVRSIIDGFKQKIKQLKQYCSKLNKTNTKLKRIINNSKIKKFSSKRKQLYRPRKNKRSNISSVSTST